MPVGNYLTKLLYVVFGTIVVGFGITITIKADVILNSGEALVKAIADKKGKIFANVKVGFDVSCVMLAVMLSLLFFDLTIVGTREGTIISALLTGNVVRFFQKYFIKNR